MCWCKNPQPNHSHVSAKAWYRKRVPSTRSSFADPDPKAEAFYYFAGLMYKLGITITY